MKEKVFVVLISLFFSLFLVSPILITIPKTPPKTVNMLVGNYFEDYYEYLSFVKQGTKGKILLENLFANDDNSRFVFAWWPYSLLGFLGYITHLTFPPQLMFWFSAIFLSFLFLLLTYAAVSLLLPQGNPLIKILAFLIVMTASPLFNINMDKGLKILPYNFWYSIGYPAARYNIATPHQLLAQIILLLGLLFITNKGKETIIKKSLILIIISFLLLSLSPPHLMLLWLSYFAAMLISSILEYFGKSGRENNLKSQLRIFFPFTITSIFVFSFIFLFKQILLSPPIISSGRLWDIAHMLYPSPSLFLFSTGLILIFGILGLPFYFSRLTFARLLFFLVAIFSFFLTNVPLIFKGVNILTYIGVHNLRFQTACSYIFLGVSSIELLKKIFKKNLYILLFSLIIIVSFFPPLFLFWQDAQATPYYLSFLQYMPEELYQAIQFLESQKDNSIILTSPDSSLGIAVPAISGRRVYLGRSIFTSDLENKKIKSYRFYNLQMTQEEAKDFLAKEKIGYVLLSYASMETNRQHFSTYYSFLKPIFSNSQLTIYTPP